MKVGVQLYSVRDYLSPDQIDKTLDILRGIGYTCVETAGYCGLPVEHFAALLKKHDLEAVSTHTGMEALIKNFDRSVEEHNILGARQCAVPGKPGEYYKNTAAGWTAFGETLNELAARLADKGISLSYHNHWQEFAPIGDSCGQALVLDSAPLVNLQLDCGHARRVTENVEDWLLRYNNRIKSVHFKDTAYNPQKGDISLDVPIGEGLVNWEGVTKAIKSSGCECIIVEHEHFMRDARDVFESSYRKIASLFSL